jgi:hypothetical protein
VYRFACLHALQTQYPFNNVNLAQRSPPVNLPGREACFVPKKVLGAGWQIALIARRQSAPLGHNLYSNGQIKQCGSGQNCHPFRNSLLGRKQRVHQDYMASMHLLGTRGYREKCVALERKSQSCRYCCCCCCCCCCCKSGAWVLNVSLELVHSAPIVRHGQRET